MKVCTKCNVEKELDQYYKYYHSTQQKWRVRGECTDCYYKTRLKRKNPELYYKENPEYKKCKTCSTWKHIDDYYFHSRVTGVKFNVCKICQNIKDKELYDLELENKGGSDRIKNNPNDFTDKWQKEQTFMVMEVLGYIYNEDSGIWTKPGVKEIVDGEIVFSKIKKKPRVGVYQVKVDYDKLVLMQEYRRLGYTYKRIANKLNISDTTVYKYLNAKTN